jgi:CubicO group peptidase (beta-lactamase class C family)
MHDLDGYLDDHCVTGLLVIHAGEIVTEIYRAGADEHTLFTSMSVAKSITTTLLGVALNEGLVGSLDDSVSKYVTALAGSEYDDVPIRDLLRMRSGVSWTETYTDPLSDRRRLLEAQLSGEPGSMLRVMASLGRTAASGTRFNYSTGETHVVGALVRAATGTALAEYLSHKIWQPCGMEAAAQWSLESGYGLEVGGSGLAATLRDFGRFGELIRRDGIVDGVRLLPDGFVAEATAAGPRQPGEPPYGFMWWPVDVAEHGHVHAGAFQASGIFGQHIYVQPAASVVIVQTSALSAPIDAEPYPEEDCYAAIVTALTG